MQEEELIDGKVDWRGRTAVRHKHGGMKVSLLVLGNQDQDSWIFFVLQVVIKCKRKLN
jgi:peptide/histidine transporter 3/4